MSDSFRKESRKDWSSGDERPPTVEQITLGCFLRIADATELMAKRHDELVRAKEIAQREATHYRELYLSLERSLRAMRGQVTRLKNAAKANGSAA